LFIFALRLNLGSLVLSITSRSLIMIWIGIEIRMLRFLLVLMFSDLYQEHSNTVKYFLFQSMGSIILLLRISLLRELKMLRILVTMMKLGIAPFHLWFISLMRKISIMRLVWVRVVQKIIPLRFIIVIKGASGLVTLLVIRFLLSVMHIIVQTKLTIIVGSSSVYSLSWVVISLISSESLMWHFFVLYCLFQIITLVTISLVSLSPFKPSSQGSYAESRILLFFSLNIAGFPPSLLFFTKLGVILETLTRAYFAIRLILILGTRVVIYNYINMTIIMFSISPRRLGV
jgi:NADH:ubiquinone oxidoreductase subunit 2 (subunit N)